MKCGGLDVVADDAGVRLTGMVPTDSVGRRVDAALTRILRNHTRWQVGRLVDAGAVTLDERVARRQDRLPAGGAIEVRVLEPPDGWYEPDEGPVQVLFEDEHLVAVDKPSGQTAHPVGTRQSGTLLNQVQAYFDRTGVRGLLRPGVVHRLDRLTSGVMVLAKTQAAHASLTRAFELGNVSKTYVAILVGELEGSGGVIDRPIGRSPCGTSLLGSTAPDAIDAKRAVTRYRVVARRAGRTVVLCRPRTGRNHQIRVHFASLGFPLVGEPFYRGDGTLGPKDGPSPAERLGLHARSLTFRHPCEEQSVRIVSELPADFPAWRYVPDVRPD